MVLILIISTILVFGVLVELVMNPFKIEYEVENGQRPLD
jgi:hypothetical protein